jgi:LmbE family N-acetylglucosaminyl deacetylase
MTDNGHILAFMAHPDDIEILCAGTLIHLRNKGYTIHMATMTAGDGGSMDLSGEEIARLRLKEAQASADLVQATYHCTDEKDFLIGYQPATIKRVVEIMRICQPFMVITHPPSDYMLDHELTSQLVRNACFCAGAPNMKTEALPAAPRLVGIPYLYYAAPIENKDIWGSPVRPGIAFDTTEVMNMKEAMLTCHASQREWLMQHHGIDEFVDSMRRWSAELGKAAGVAYAEGFRQHRGHAYPRDDKLTEILADKQVEILPA